MSKDPLDLRPENLLSPAKGRLLVSAPFLADPYFRRTVVLLCEHDDRGSFGFVLNRQLEIGTEELGLDLPALSMRIGIGGPVSGGELFYLHTIGRHLEGSVLVVDDVHVGGELEQLRELLRADPRLAEHVRFFVGYSGWSEGQLAREIDERSWLVTTARVTDLMSRMSDAQLWRSTLKRMGGDYAPLANFPEDPSLN
ncbi:MAG: YqgE/AlgH family protein [Flavobacteriales bacterium]|nr:YqgE/AlgH family protein [Flavobacteriales bacterium]